VPRLNEPTGELEKKDQPNSEDAAQRQSRSNWVRSAEARKTLKLSTCDLAHKRDSGEIESKKVGNAYLYKLPTDI